MRRTTETRSEAISPWIREHVGRKHRYRPPPRGEAPKGTSLVRKELAGRFHQLLLGHAATAEHLRRVGQAPSDRCWYGSGERQSRFHLFAKRRRWGPEIRRLWQRVERGCERGGPRAPSVRLLSWDVRAAPAVLEFLGDSGVGWMPGRVLLAGGPDVDEEEMDEVVLWAPEEEEGTRISESEGGMGQAHPSSMLSPLFSFVFPFASFFVYLLRIFQGCRRPGYPTMAARAGLGLVWFGILYF